MEFPNDMLCHRRESICSLLPFVALAKPYPAVQHSLKVILLFSFILIAHSVYGIEYFGVLLIIHTTLFLHHKIRCIMLWTITWMTSTVLQYIKHFWSLNNIWNMNRIVKCKCLCTEINPMSCSSWRIFVLTSKSWSRLRRARVRQNYFTVYILCIK